MLHQHNPFLQEGSSYKSNDLKSIPYVRVDSKTSTFRFYLPPHLRDNNVGRICGCIQEDMYIALYQWAKTGFPQKGLNDLCQLVWEQKDRNVDEWKISDEAKQMLAETLYSMELTSSWDVEKQPYIPTFCVNYFNITFQQGMVILHVLEDMDYISHGTALRCPWTKDEKADAFLKATDPDQTVKKRVLEWLQNNECQINSIRKVYYRDENEITFMPSTFRDAAQDNYKTWEKPLRQSSGFNNSSSIPNNAAAKQ